MKAQTTVLYIRCADREIVDQLVATHGADMLALAVANRRLRRSGQSFLPRDEHMLAVVTRRQAEKLGLQISGSPHYVILGMLDNCQLAKSINAHINNDTESMKHAIDAAV